jgi:hypothetical protein
MGLANTFRSTVKDNSKQMGYKLYYAENMGRLKAYKLR